MRLFGAALLGLSLATSAAVLSRPASAENFQQRLEQGAQALLGQNQDQNGYQDRDRNAYEQGRRDEWRRQHADRNGDGRDYGDRHYDNRHGDSGIGSYAGRNDGDRYYDRQPAQDQNWGQRRYPDRNDNYDNR